MKLTNNTNKEEEINSLNSTLLSQALSTVLSSVLSVFVHFVLCTHTTHTQLFIEHIDI